MLFWKVLWDTIKDSDAILLPYVVSLRDEKDKIMKMYEDAIELIKKCDRR